MRNLILAAMLLLPAFAYTYTWNRNWEDRCTDDELVDFVVYWNASEYRTSTGMLVLRVEPRTDYLKYLRNYSYIKFAGDLKPLIPGFPFPDYLLRAGVNYTFFVPFEFSENSLEMRVVGNSTGGEPRCELAGWGLKSWHRKGDVRMPLSSAVKFDPSTHRFVYTLTNDGVEPVENVFIAVFSGTELEEVRFTTASQGETELESLREYNSSDVSAGRYTVYVVAENETASHFEVHNLFEFYDFELETPEKKEFLPGESYDIRLTLRNTGYLADSYYVNVSVPENWVVTVTSPGSLSRGESKDITLHYEVYQYQVGEEVLSINVTSKETGRVKEYRLELVPKGYTVIVPQISGISSISAYSANKFNLTVASSGTVNPSIFYYTYTEPAILITGGVGNFEAEVGEISTRDIEFTAGSACAFQNEDAMGFNAGRKVLMLAKLTYEISSDKGKVQELERIREMVDIEKLKMTSTNSQRLFSQADSLEQWIDRYVEAINSSRSSEYLASLRENLYLKILDIDATLQEAGSRMSEDCYSVEGVRLSVGLTDANTLQSKEAEIQVDVEGAKMFELIGPTELKAIAGDTTEYSFKLKNNAPEDFVIGIVPGTDIIKIPEEVYLRAGAVKTVNLRIRPDEFMEDELSTYIELRSRTYTIQFPLTVSVGKLDPQLSASSLYAVMPNQESWINITLRTGGLDDTFHVELDGPEWVEGPDKVVTEDGKGIIRLRVMAPESSDRYEGVDLRVTSESFPDYTARKGFDIKVDTETPALLERVNSYRRLAESKKEGGTLSAENYRLVMDTLEDAERYLSQGKISTAKIKLNAASKILSREEKQGGPNYRLIAALLVLAGSAFAFWKFLLPRIRGTGRPPVEEEVI